MNTPRKFYFNRLGNEVYSLEMQSAESSFIVYNSVLHLISATTVQTSVQSDDTRAVPMCVASLQTTGKLKSLSVQFASYKQD